MKRSIACAAVLLAVVSAVSAGETALFGVRQETGAVRVTSPDGKPIFEYRTARPADSKLSVESACYFHLVATPEGVVVTEVAPADHLHHRGIFLAFVEMHGAKDADFWGWGEHAPKAGRAIVNRLARVGPAGPGIAARNEWVADGAVVLREDLVASVRQVPRANVIDLSWTLTPDADTSLPRWAFSGFCVRLRKDGGVEATGPKGKVDLPDPIHTQPESDWPASPWYDFTLKLEDGKVAGAAVLDHPKNPPALWHNHRGLRMINPCIVAPAALTLKAGQPLVLRYMVVVHDGPAPADLLEKLHREWPKDPPAAGGPAPGAVRG